MLGPFRVFAWMPMGVIALALLLCVTHAARAAEPDLRAQLRAHIANPEYTLGRKPEYVVTDPAFVDTVLDKALKYLDPRKPLTPADIDRAKQSAVTYYRLGLAEPDGLAALEQRIAARFAKPVVTRTPGRDNPQSEIIELDFGWMAGKLAKTTRGIEHDRNGANVENGLPSTRLLAGLLADAARAHPKAERISLLITFPRTRRLGDKLRASFQRVGMPQSLIGWVVIESAVPTASRSRYPVWAGDEQFSAYRDGRHSFYEDCAPTPSAARTPNIAGPAVRPDPRCHAPAGKRNG